MFFFGHDVIKPREYTLIDQYTTSSYSSHTTLASTMNDVYVNHPILLQAWPEMKVQFAEIFQTKTRNEWVMTSAMLKHRKPPEVPLLILCHSQNDTTTTYKETCSKQSMAGCSWFQTVSSILVAPFSQKICLVYFSGVFCLPQAEVFKGTDACCVPVLNPSEAVGVLSC